MVTRNFSCVIPVVLLVGPLSTSAWIDTTSRWHTRDYYNHIYSLSEEMETGWTGDYGAGAVGTLADAWQEATLLRIRYFRNMAGVPDDISFDPGFNAAAQEAAFMMSVNGAITHFPPTDWAYYTEGAAQAAQNSNLAWGVNGPHAVDGYMIDFGPPNDIVGHRRWILFPPTSIMGNGDAPGDGGANNPVNVLWVIPDSIGPRPQTREEFVAWPPAGHIPASLVYARWSFSHPGADFSNATVSMESGGASIPVVLETWSDAFIGDPTLVWVPNDMDNTTHDYWPTPTADETVIVNVGNVLINGSPQSFTYEVTIINPRQPGPAEQETILSAAGPVIPTVPAEFTSTSRPWAEGIQARTFTAGPYSGTLGAESGIAPFEANVSAGYSPIQSQRVASGQSAYHLAHSEPRWQALTLPDEFLVEGNMPKIEFASSLAWATPDQIASVKINAGSGGNWQPVWEKSGPVDHNSNFESVAIDLSPWSGRTIRIRFSYDLTGLNHYPDSDPAIGWAFDNILISGVQRVDAPSELPPVMDDSTTTATFGSMETVYLQGREFAFGGIPLDWGLVTAVSPMRHESVTTSVGSWVEDPVIGWNFGSDVNWTYVLNLEWTYIPEFPWIYSGAGWLYYLNGSVRNGLWMYHPSHGYAFTRIEFGGWFIHEPFHADSWKPFSP